MTEKAHLPAPTAVLTAGSAPEEPAPDPGPTVLRDCADAEAYVASVCFKHGPPQLTGVELEWLIHPVGAPEAPVDVPTLVAALGEHCPTTIDPAAPALPLPGGSTVTVEPGGQVELASPPLPDLADLLSVTQADILALHRRLAAYGLVAEPRATDPLRPPVRILDLPRYRAMERYFDRSGPDGRRAMCSTAAVQVSLDVGERAEVACRWAVLHELGPALLGAFANSPMLCGQVTGWKSSRWISWLRAGPERSAPPPVLDADPAAAWASRVLDAPVLCVRGAGAEWRVPERMSFAEWIRGGIPVPPTLDDLRYHITTMFPPVRPQGHLEVRYVDAQAGRRWALPTAVLSALLADPATIDAARAAAAPAVGRWFEAARGGLSDPQVAAAALAVFELAAARLPALGAPQWLLDDLVTMTEQQVARGLCPADLPADAVEENP